MNSESPYPPIRAITFDLDDTLWDIWPVIERAEERLHAWLEERYPRIPVLFTSLELRALCFAIAEQHPHLAHDRSALRKEGLRLAAQRTDYQDFQVELAFEVFFQARNEVVLFEDVLPVLERLSQRYTLGAITNGNADIRLIGLDHLFAFSISAIEVGVAKPEPVIFEAACRYLELAPQQVVHVGDDPEHDVLGASRAGMRTVWVNRTGKQWPYDERPDAEINSFRELEILLKQWEPQ